MCKTIDGSSRFEVVVVEPESNVIKAALYLCICNDCWLSYGSWNLFYIVEVNEVPEKSVLRSSIQPESGAPTEDDTALEFVAVGTICAIPSLEYSSDTVDFF